MALTSPKHPVWSLLRMAIVMAGMLGFMSIFAEKFDKTEWYTLAGMFFVVAGVEIPSFVRKTPPNE